MSKILPADFVDLYAGFDAPLSALDCGQKCAPYNQGVPVCCDTRHTVPTAYLAEWDYLAANTDLWHRWTDADSAETLRLQEAAGDMLVLIACQGHTHCQRDYRSIVCRAFPFFPYFNSQGKLLGLSYYWEYEDRCWVISNLDIVTETYLAQFLKAYRALFEYLPGEQGNFEYHSAEMRRVFQVRRRAITLLHENGSLYKITPHNERMRKMTGQLPSKFGPYRIADLLLFPDEL